MTTTPALNLLDLLDQRRSVPARQLGEPAPDAAQLERLLQAFLVEKALYELGYELNSRPEWARIPLQALATLATPMQR